MIYIVAGNAGNNVTTEHVNSIFVHPSYDERTMANNIALLKVTAAQMNSMRKFFHIYLYTLFITIGAASMEFSLLDPIANIYMHI